MPVPAIDRSPCIRLTPTASPGWRGAPDCAAVPPAVAPPTTAAMPADRNSGAMWSNAAGVNPVMPMGVAMGRSRAPAPAGSPRASTSPGRAAKGSGPSRRVASRPVKASAASGRTRSGAARAARTGDCAASRSISSMGVMPAMAVLENVPSE